ncbi:MAG: hypothetical protein KDD61_01985 [Bdellovibrionales bacterium]|nr:hypothetical protein [Bdellovibrionales bacterium]
MPQKSSSQKSKPDDKKKKNSANGWSTAPDTSSVIPEDVEKIVDKRPASIPKNPLLTRMLKKMTNVHEYGIWDSQKRIPWTQSKNKISIENQWDQEIHTYQSDSGQRLTVSINFHKENPQLVKTFFQEHKYAEKIVRVYKVDLAGDLKEISPLQYRSLKSSINCTQCHKQ